MARKKRVRRPHVRADKKQTPPLSSTRETKSLPSSATRIPQAVDGGIRFSFVEIDEGGKWSVCALDTSRARRLFKKMGMLEKITLQEAMQSHHLAKLDMSVCPNKAATRRLAEEYAGLDVRHEIRVERSRSGRLLGRLQGRVFSVIWWDPDHEVWPEGKVYR